MVFHWSRPGNDLDVDVDVYEDDFKEGDRDDKIKKDADAPNNVDVDEAEDAPNIEPIFNIVYYRMPFIGIDLGTMLSADFAAAAVLIRFFSSFLLQFNKKQKNDKTNKIRYQR